MNATIQDVTVQERIQRRLDAIEARLTAAIRQGQRILGESLSAIGPDDDPVHKLDAIEAKLEALEKELRRVDDEMRKRESPPLSFAPTVEFSDGPHYPGLG